MLDLIVKRWNVLVTEFPPSGRTRATRLSPELHPADESADGKQSGACMVALADSFYLVSTALFSLLAIGFGIRLPSPPKRAQDG